MAHINLSITGIKTFLLKFTQRLKYYLIGFGLGLFLVFLLFKDRTWSWLPENRVLDFIVEHPILVDKNIYPSLLTLLI